MEPATAAFRLSALPGIGRVMRSWHDASQSAGMPCASLPTTRSIFARASSDGCLPPSTTRAQSGGRLDVSTSSCQDRSTMFAVPIAPALACTAFGPHGSVPSMVTTVFFPIDTADRMSVPMLPGSATRARTRPGSNFVGAGRDDMANMPKMPLGELLGLIFCMTASLTKKIVLGSASWVAAASIASVEKRVRDLWPYWIRAEHVLVPSAINFRS